MARTHGARSLAGLVMAVVVAIAACASPGGPSSTAPAPSAAIGTDALRYSCASFPFGADLLDEGPGTDELADDPLAAALRAHLSTPNIDADFLPDSGWHLVGRDGQTAEYVSIDADNNMTFVTVEGQDATWTVTGWGGCQPQIVLGPGLGPARWTFDPAHPEPDAATQVFDALVTEMACNSGEPADGRIVGPEIVAGPDQVLVFFATRPRGGIQNCPANPSTRVRVDLGEPLGDRELLDGGRLPPGDPSEPLF